MVNYFVCPRLFDTFSSINLDEIDELIKFLSVNYLIIDYNEKIYIACRDIIDFYCDYIRNDKQCDTCFTPNDTINCLDLVCYGFQDCCSKCERIILVFFSDYLCKIEK